MLEYFTTREVALFLWAGIFLTWALAKKSMRLSVLNLIHAIFVKKLSALYLVLALYTIGMIWSLYLFNLWDSSQIKNTVLWFFTIGIVSVFTVNNKNTENYFEITFNNIFSFTVILQFIISIYTFSLFTELVFVPVGVLIIGMIAVGERDPKNKKLTKHLRNLLNYFGLFLIGFATFRIINDVTSISNTEVLKDFLIPAILSIMFLPAVYLISLYLTQESTFIGLERSAIKPELIPYARWQAFMGFGFSKSDMQRWRSLVVLRELKTKADIHDSIRLINELKRTEKNPPTVSALEGWSPFQAKKFLSRSGIKTGYYHPYFDDDGWSASSAYKVIEENPHLDNVAYYVYGNKEAATKLELVLNVHSAQHSGISIQKMIDYSTTLYLAALNKTLPKEIESAIRNKRNYKITSPNRAISVSVNKWLEHKLNGFNIKLSVEVKSS